MAVRPPVSYPGVYVQEVPSGVRTIVGVSTSIAVFIGRAKQGPMDTPTLCLNFADFERGFSLSYAGSDLARAVRLFFQNGGTQCYVMRIADNATQSDVTLKNQDDEDVLIVRAKEHGVMGDDIRNAVTYNGLHPELTFNLEVFRWVATNTGAKVKADRELWRALTMEPNTGRYAVDYVNQNSALFEVTDVKEEAGEAVSDPGYSQSGRPVGNGVGPTNADDPVFRDEWMRLIGRDSTDNTNLFRIIVDRKGFVEVDLSSINFNVPPLDTPADARANLGNEMKALIDSTLAGGSEVTVTFETGPTGPAGADHENTVLLRIASPNGDVRIEPAAINDLAGPLMLGTAQGGLEVSRYAARRPVPNGIVFDPTDLVTFAEQEQTAFNTFTIGTTDIDLRTTLETVDPAVIPSPRMYQDAYSPSTTGNNDGVREKWGIIAEAINKKTVGDTTFKWSAEVWGSRLALIPGEGGDNSQGSIATSGGDGVDIGDNFIPNVRYYSLGASGRGAPAQPEGAKRS